MYRKVTVILVELAERNNFGVHGVVQQRPVVGYFIPELFEIAKRDAQDAQGAEVNEKALLNQAIITPNQNPQRVIKQIYQQRLANQQWLPEFVSKGQLSRYSDLLTGQEQVMMKTTSFRFELRPATFLDQAQYMLQSFYDLWVEGHEQFDQQYLEQLNSRQRISELSYEQLEAAKAGIDAARSWLDWTKSLVHVNSYVYYGLYRAGRQLIVNQATHGDRFLEVGECLRDARGSRRNMD